MVKVKFFLVDEYGKYERTIEFKDLDYASLWLHTNGKIVSGYEILATAGVK